MHTKFNNKKKNKTGSSIKESKSNNQMIPTKKNADEKARGSRTRKRHSKTKGISLITRQHVFQIKSLEAK